MVSGQHLQRFNTSLYSCQGCRVVCPIRTYPCRCHQYRLGEPKESTEPEASNELRTAWKRQGLSKMAQRMLLLGPQVPMGRYTITTYIALNDWYSTVNSIPYRTWRAHFAETSLRLMCRIIVSWLQTLG